MAPTDPPSSTPVGGDRKKPWLKRLLIGAAAAVVLLAVGGYLVVPMIAASKAPGIIEEAAAKGISGSVKVKSVSVGWGGPAIVRGLELRDPEGNLVGTFDVESSLGIWKALGGLKDLGTAKVSGRLDVVRSTDASGVATTNFERALRGKGGAAPGGGSGGTTRIPELNLTLDVAGIDATFVERDAGGVERGRAAMKQLKGTVAVATAGSPTAKAALNATFGETIDGPSTGSLSVDATVTGLIAGGVLTLDKASIDATVEATGAPMNLLDALASQGGVLSGALGATADAKIKLKGPLSALDADAVISAPNATADLGIRTEGTGDASRLRATRKGIVTLKSLAFLERSPSVAKGLSDAGIAVSHWPGATVTIDSLDLPAGASAGWAGAKAEVSLLTSSELRGTIRRRGPAAAELAPEALVVRQVSLGVIAKDLVKGVDIIGYTGVTIGGQSAGDLDLNVQLSELIGTDGRLAISSGSVPGKIIGKLEAKSVATGLLTPFVTSSGLPLELATDVGPTVDLVLNATTKGVGTAGGGAAIPPTDIMLSVKSANVTASGALLYDATGLGLAPQGEPLRLTVERGAPLVQRLLAKDAAADAAPAVSGTGRLEVVVTQARLPLSGKKLDIPLASGAAHVTVSDLVVRAPGEQGVTVGAERVTLSASVMPQMPSSINAQGRLLLNGQAADLACDAKVSGLLEEQELPRLAGLGTRRLAGRATLSGVSGSALQGLVVGASAGEPMKRIAAELIGSRIDVAIDLGERPSGNLQPLAVTVSGPAMNAAVQGELRADGLELTRMEGTANLTDALARGVLELAGQTGEAVAGARLREPTTVSVRVQPVMIPLKPQSFTPDWAGARSILAVTAGLVRPAIVDGLRVDGRTLSAGVANFAVDAAVPLSVMDTTGGRAPGTAGLRLTASMDVVGNGEQDVLARLRASGGSGADGSRPRVQVNLTDVATGRLDEITGQGGLLTGLLGDRATVVAEVSTAGEGQTELRLDVESPQLEVKSAQLLVSKEAYRAAGPFTVSLTASPTLVEQRVLGIKPGETNASNGRIAEPVKVSLSVKSFALSAPGPDEAGGPLKPGVFTIDAVAASPRIVLARPVTAAPVEGSDRSRPGRAARVVGTETTELSEFTATLKSTGNASSTGIAFTASVGSVRTNGQVVNDPTVVRGTVDNLADVGGRVQADSAVLNLNATTGRLPTALIESLINGSGKLTEMLGDELTADVEARDVSKTGASGFLSVKLKSPKSSLVAGGPVNGGVMDTGAPGATPLRLELNEFRFGGGGELLKIFPIFAEMQRAAGE
ncbi:MAG TPA: hypothetical protein VEB22_09410, partial [Phycisphaerales bacterium]|nr:hypothetical protein [Phycisphaerales bacterium]